MSPDGRRVVVARTVQGNEDLWLLDGARVSRVTFDPALDRAPLWSPDGTRIVFRALRTGAGDLYQTLANGGGGEERLVASDQGLIPTSWSPDGRFLLYMSVDPPSNVDLWVAPLVGDPTPSVLLKTPFQDTYGAFSPDGRWVAYHWNASGRNEIYLRRFVPPSPQASTFASATADKSADKPGAAGTPTGAAGGQWQVSTAGGIMARWRPDGKELYYLNPEGAKMAAPIAVVGNALEPGAPVVLFPTRIVGGGVEVQVGRQYDVAPDGRFLINMELPGAAAPITLIQNWKPPVQQ